MSNYCFTSQVMAVLSDEEKRQLQAVKKRVESLGQCAKDKGVRLMVDAEQTYYQPAIRHIAVDMMMPKYNLTRPVIYDTQQCYLKVCDVCVCLCVCLLHVVVTNRMQWIPSL